MKQPLRIIVILLALALLAGCGGGDKPAPTAASGQAEPTPVAGQPATAAPAQATAAPMQPTAAPAEPASAPTAMAPEPVATEEADLELTDREEALSKLKSYVMTWSMTWTGKNDGQEQTVDWTSTQRYTAEPKAMHTMLEFTDDLNSDSGDVFEMIQIGTQTYILTEEAGEQQCIAMSSDDNTVEESWMGPNAFGSVRGGRYIGQETVNGIRTKHYRYDEKATGINVYTRLSGDIWVAVDGGYAVKDVAEWEGSLLGLGDDSTEAGKGSWTWELSEVNEPLEIIAPPGCESAAAGMPILPDATERTTFGDMTTYKTATKMADAVAFYEAEMPAAGWTAAEGGMSMDEFATLMFTKDDQKATVMISVDEGTVNVMISVEK